MRTKIHTTRKLEKLIKKYISNDKVSESGKLGKWNATVFYVSRKKCWLISNRLVMYMPFSAWYDSGFTRGLLLPFFR
jgi:hypothetical protein